MMLCRDSWLCGVPHNRDGNGGAPQRIKTASRGQPCKGRCMDDGRRMTEPCERGEGRRFTEWSGRSWHARILIRPHFTGCLGEGSNSSFPALGVLRREFGHWPSTAQFSPWRLAATSTTTTWFPKEHVLTEVRSTSSGITIATKMRTPKSGYPQRKTTRSASAPEPERYLEIPGLGHGEHHGILRRQGETSV